MGSSRTEAKRKSDPVDTISEIGASRRVQLGPDSPLTDILGTVNQVIVTPTGAFIVLSTPQDIDVGADVVFGSVTSGAFNIGDPSANGSYRLIASGDNLNFERREAGVWVRISDIRP